MFGKQSPNYERERIEEKREAIYNLYASISSSIVQVAIIVLFIIWVIDRIEMHFLWVLSPIPIALILGIIVNFIIKKTVKD